MRLIPSSCDLDLVVVQRFLKLTEQVSGTIHPFTFEVDKIGNNLYTITLHLTKNILQLHKLDVRLSYLKGEISVPKKIIPDPSLQELAEAVPTVTATLSGILGVSFFGTLAVGATPSLWSIISFNNSLDILFISISNILTTCKYS